MILGSAENNGFFILIDFIEKNLCPLGFALFDLDNFIEVSFFIDFTFFLYSDFYKWLILI